MSKEPCRLLWDNRQSAGDVLLITACLRDLMKNYPGRYEVDYVGHHGRLSDGNNFFENNPLITPFYEGPPHEVEKHCHDCRYIPMSYNYGIQRPNRRHFIEAFHEDLSHKLGHGIEFTEFKADLYLSLGERELWPGLPERYFIIDAGRKADFTAKYWSSHRFQEVVNATCDRVTWVQIGGAGDYHPPLQNVINLIGKTNLRQLIQVFYRASLVLTPVSLPMHLAPAVPTPDGKPRPCIVLMGKREQRVWELYDNHIALGTNGLLRCGENDNGGCWRNKTKKLDGDNSICRLPLQDELGEWLPECLHRITVQQVVDAVSLYL